MAEGTKDVSSDLQARTNINQNDRLLMVNSSTNEVQYLTVSQVVIEGASSIVPTPSDESFIIT